MRQQIDIGYVKNATVESAEPVLDRCREKLNDERRNYGFMTGDSQSRLNSTFVDVRHNPKSTVTKSSRISCPILASKSGYLSRGLIYFPSKGATMKNRNLEVSAVGTWS